MSLTIRLKPNEKIIIGGAVIKNGNHSSEFQMQNQVPILRCKDIMSEADAITPARQIYFQLQLIYIDTERRELHTNIFADLTENFLTISNHPSEAKKLMHSIINLLTANEYYQALKVAKELIVLEDS